MTLRLNRGRERPRFRSEQALRPDWQAVPPGAGQAIELPADSPLRHLADRPTLVILLRSFGCTFCREALSDVAAVKQSIRLAGTELAFVHGASSSEAAPWFQKFDLDDTVQISDPDLAHYRAFGLGRTTAGALVDPVVWTRGAVCALAHGFGAQTPAMLRQLPGVFVLQGDRVIAAYRHRSPADRPDYLALVSMTRRHSEP